MSATVNLEAIKKELSDLQQSVTSLTSANVPIPAILTERIDKLQKQLAGNNSQQTADLFNTTLAKIFTTDKNAELTATVAKLAGETGVRVKIVAKAILDANGQPVMDSTGKFPTYAVTFEAAGTGGGGASTGAGAGTGGTKSESAFNQYTVTANADAVKEFGYKGTATPDGGVSQVLESGSEALKYILNGGKNPMGRAEGFGKGNSAPRVLESFDKDVNFKKYMSWVGEKVEKAKTEAAPAAATETAATTTTATTEAPKA